MKEFFTIEVLLAITFVFGVLQFLTMTKLFGQWIGFINDVIFKVSENEGYSRHHSLIRNLFRKLMNSIKNLWRTLGVWFFYFSLCFQAWYWLFSDKSIFN